MLQDAVMTKYGTRSVSQLSHKAQLLDGKAALLLAVAQ